MTVSAMCVCAIYNIYTIYIYIIDDPPPSTAQHTPFPASS